MPDWSKSMTRTFEYYIVDPGTWKDTKKLITVKPGSTLTRDSDQDTLGSATIDINESVGECYIRVYLITVQNGVTERHALGTYLVQTPSSSFDGKVRSVSMDAYTPLIELKENPTPLGYYIPKSAFHKVEYNNGVYTVAEETIDPILGEEVAGAKTATGEQVFQKSTGDRGYYCVIEFPMDVVYRLLREHMRAPVVKPKSVSPLYSDFVADTEDTWFSFLDDLLAQMDHQFELDELGRVLIAPKQDTASLQPVWTYTDDNSSILYPELNMEHDLYGIPNVVEAVYFDGKHYVVRRVSNIDENSPTSIPNRGREIVYRDTNPDIVGAPTKEGIEEQLDEYIEKLLKALSTIEYTISYSHGYCPVRLGDCVRLNYERAGLKNIKARVISQSIKCDSECKVTEKAVFTTNLWR